MRVGFIGAGTVTGTFGRHLIIAGHTLVVSNSRGPKTGYGSCIRPTALVKPPLMGRSAHPYVQGRTDARPPRHAGPITAWTVEQHFIVSRWGGLSARCARRPRARRFRRSGWQGRMATAPAVESRRSMESKNANPLKDLKNVGVRHRSNRNHSLRSTHWPDALVAAWLSTHSQPTIPFQGAYAAPIRIHFKPRRVA